MSSSPVKLPDFPPVTSLAGNDRVVAMANSAGIVNSSLITINDMVGNSGFIPVISTPANSTAINAVAGSLMRDGSYLYVATSNNYLMRIPLSSF